MDPIYNQVYSTMNQGHDGKQSSIQLHEIVFKAYVDTLSLSGVSPQQSLVLAWEGISPQVILASKALPELQGQEVKVEETMEFGMQLVHDGLVGRYYVRKVAIKLLTRSLQSQQQELLASLLINLADIPNNGLYTELKQYAMTNRFQDRSSKFSIKFKISSIDATPPPISNNQLLFSFSNKYSRPNSASCSLEASKPPKKILQGSASLNSLADHHDKELKQLKQKVDSAQESMRQMKVEFEWQKKELQNQVEALQLQTEHMAELQAKVQESAAIMTKLAQQVETLKKQNGSLIRTMRDMQGKAIVLHRDPQKQDYGDPQKQDNQIILDLQAELEQAWAALMNKEQQFQSQAEHAARRVKQLQNAVESLTSHISIKDQTIQSLRCQINQLSIKLTNSQKLLVEKDIQFETNTQTLNELKKKAERQEEKISLKHYCLLKKQIQQIPQDKGQKRKQEEQELLFINEAISAMLEQAGKEKQIRNDNSEETKKLILMLQEDSQSVKRSQSGKNKKLMRASSDVMRQSSNSHEKNEADKHFLMIEDLSISAIRKCTREEGCEAHHDLLRAEEKLKELTEKLKQLEELHKNLEEAHSVVLIAKNEAERKYSQLLEGEIQIKKELVFANCRSQQLEKQRKSTKEILNSFVQREDRWKTELTEYQRIIQRQMCFLKDLKDQNTMLEASKPKEIDLKNALGRLNSIFIRLIRFQKKLSQKTYKQEVDEFLEVLSGVAADLEQASTQVQR